MDLLQILHDKQIEFQTTNNPAEIKVKCTSGNHPDNTPSLHYHLEKNIFHCWSCDFKGGSKKFLESIGIHTAFELETRQTFKIQRLKEKLNRVQNFPVYMPSVQYPVVSEFHKINVETLKEFEAFLTTELNLEDYICFPVVQNKVLKFIEARYKFSDTKKAKYQRKPYGSVSDNILFPLDKLESTKEVILVEGIFDMLNLWQHGIRNVLCIFGTSNFGIKKAEILHNLGVISVKIMMDGDDSGQQATQKISQLLSNKEINTIPIKLSNTKDPGSLEKFEIDYYLHRGTT